jgi:hypothetical protein
MFAFPSSDYKGPLVFTIDPSMVSMSTYFNLFLTCLFGVYSTLQALPYGISHIHRCLIKKTD